LDLTLASSERRKGDELPRNATDLAVYAEMFFFFTPWSSNILKSPARIMTALGSDKNVMNMHSA